MILLDTNVVSAVMAPQPPNAVLEWLNQRETELLFLSTVTVAEIAYGIRALPNGKRQKHLGAKFDEFIDRGFEQRILSFDVGAALDFAELMAHRKKIGRPMSFPDGQIAAMARHNHFALATRNIKDFEECGLELVDPFQG